LGRGASVPPVFKIGNVVFYRTDVSGDFEALREAVEKIRR
jgi:hypothetical protein